MRLVITGGSGFLGSALVRRLVPAGHRITLLTRRAGTAVPAPLPAGVHVLPWPARPEVGTTIAPWEEAIGSADAVVHLAGASIAGGRWTAARKAEILASRIDATTAVVEAVRRARQSGTQPRVIVSASAVGYYGPCGDEEVTEAHPPGDDFLARVCRAWETSVEEAAPLGVRVVRVRTGVVLDARHGALPQLMRPFRLGFGGPIGSGEAWVPWIHRDDWTALVEFALVADGLEGAVNACAPEPVRQRTLATALGRALHRRSWLPAPAWALRLAFGEMADAVLLSGQRAVPRAAERAGFWFTHVDLDEALAALDLHA